MKPSDGIRIEPVETRAQREAFIDLPYRLHERRQYFVPPLRRDVRRLLDPDVHPFHKHGEVALFLARREGSELPVGRVAAIVNRLHNEVHNDKAGFIGFFDADDDPAIFRALFDRAAAWLKQRGRDTMIGPCSFSTNEECGLLVDGFDRYPSLMIPWNPPYYATHIEALAPSTAIGLLSYWMNREELTDRLFRLHEGAKKRLERQGLLRIRPVDLKRLDAEIQIIQELYNNAWKDNWGFVPMTGDEVAFMAAEMKAIIDPRIILIAEFDGKPAGFSLALPDFNIVLAHLGGELGPAGLLKTFLLRKSIKCFRLLALGIDPAFRKRGLDVILYGETALRGLAVGYFQAEFSWVLEANREMNQAMNAIGAKVIRKHRIHEWKLE